MPIFLQAISAQFYRGIGSERQFVSPLESMNFFVGANNSGKSIILDILHQRMPFTEVKPKAIRADAAERYRGANTGEPEIMVGFLPSTVIGELAHHFPDEQQSTRRGHYLNPRNFISDLLNEISHDGFIWFSAEKATFGRFYSEQGVKGLRRHCSGREREWEHVRTYLTGRSGGSFDQHWLPETLERIGGLFEPRLKEALLIPAKRQVGVKGENLDDLSGKGLIDHLAGLQNPGFHEQQKKQLFLNINAFLQEVTGKADATLVFRV